MREPRTRRELPIKGAFGCRQEWPDDGAASTTLSDESSSCDSVAGHFSFR
jgi:hypothetical protein